MSRFFIRRPDRRDRHRDPLRGRRRRHGVPAAGRAVPRDRAAADRDDRHVHRRRRAHRRAVGRHADRRAGERREAHDLHAGDLRQRRHDDAPGLVRDRHGHRHRSGAGPEPPGAGAGQPAHGGERLRPHDHPDGGHPAARLHDQLAEQDVGPELPLELRRHQRQGRAGPRARDRAGEDLRRGELRHARLGRAGHDREPGPHGDRPRERDHGAERRESRGHARRRAGAARPAAHVHGPGPRPPDERRGVRRRRRARERGRIARPA